MNIDNNSNSQPNNLNTNPVGSGVSADSTQDNMSPNSPAQPTQPKNSLAFNTLAGQTAQTTPTTMRPLATSNNFKGVGGAFKPQSTQENNSTDQDTASSSGSDKKTNKKTKLAILALIIMLISGAGLFYAFKLTQEKEVPTEPVSEPSADVEHPCSVVLTVPTPTLEPTDTPTPPTTPTAPISPTITITATPSATLTPTGTATPSATATPTSIATSTPTQPAATSAPTQPVATSAPSVPTSTPRTTTTVVTATPPPYATPLPSVPGQPQTYVVDTKAECNQACSTNADCKNISHICYNGVCRLDVNPEDQQCRTATGETTVERIVETPDAGFSNWLNYLKVGIGVIGAGILLLLFL